MTDYVYSVSNDTAIGIVYQPKLRREVTRDPTLFDLYQSIVVDGDDLTISTSSALSSEKEAVLGAVVAAHVGVPNFEFVSSALLVGRDPLTVGVDWADLGFVVTTPGAFLDSGDQGAGKAVMSALTDGTGCQMRGIHRDADEGNETVLCGPFDVPDHEGAWDFFTMFSYGCTFPLNMTELCLQARRQTATSFQVKGCSMTLLKKV